MNQVLTIKLSIALIVLAGTALVSGLITYTYVHHVESAFCIPKHPVTPQAQGMFNREPQYFNSRDGKNY